MKNKRKKIRISNYKFQITFILSAFLIALSFAFLINSFVLIPKLELNEIIPNSQVFVIVFSFILLIFSLALCLIASHQIQGSLNRFKKHMKQIANGQDPECFSFNEDDAFNGLFEVYNLVIKRMTFYQRQKALLEESYACNLMNHFKLKNEKELNSSNQKSHHM